MGMEPVVAVTDDRIPRPAPLAPLQPAFIAAAAYGAAAVLWSAVPSILPGGRWLAVHLFTLGVLSNLVLVLTEHFARTVLHLRSSRRHHGRTVMFNAGVVSLLVGLPIANTPLIASGSTVATAAVTWQFFSLRAARRATLGSRFGFVVRGYELASATFVLAAVLGFIMGTGLLASQWYSGARLAHLHLNMLGWGALTLLSTIPFFGPTMLRRRIAVGAEQQAAVALRWASSGLGVSALGLFLHGEGLGWRLLAGIGVAIYAAAATAVCWPVVNTARGAQPSPQRWGLIASCSWLLLVLWSDAVVIATGYWRALDTLGVVLLLGVLLQAIMATIGYLGPMLRSGGPRRRGELRRQLARFSGLRGAAFNLGVGLIAIAVGAGVPLVGPMGGWLILTALLSGFTPLFLRGTAAK